MSQSREEVIKTFIVSDPSGPSYLKYSRKDTHLGTMTDIQWVRDPFQATRFNSLLEIDHKFRQTLTGCEYPEVKITSQVEIST